VSHLAATAALGASGWALLRLLGLATGRWAVDVPLGWFAGAGWLALAAFVLRFLAGVPYSAATAVAVVLLPAAALMVKETVARRRRAAAEAKGPGTAEPPTNEPPPVDPARWLPRPVWLFAPLAAYVAVVALAVVLHGANTPTQTDDAMRVRAFAPMLAFEDRWSPEARSVLVFAGPLPTFAPTLAWRVTGTLDHFHANYLVLTGLLALLWLALALSASRGRPEWGWAAAFGVLSLPLLVYHATTTYADAVLATWLGAGFLLMLEHGRTGRRADAARALLLLLAAAMVKREGELVAAAAVVVLLVQAAWTARRGTGQDAGQGAGPGASQGPGQEEAAGSWTPLRLALLASPYLLVVAARVRLAGAGAAFPFLRFAAERAAETASQARPGDDAAIAVQAAARPTAGEVLPTFLEALFTTGNAGLAWWVLPATALLLASSLRRRGLLWPLAAVALLFAQAALNALWLFPEYTLNQGTVHRSLLPVSVAAVLWVAAALGWPDPAPGPDARPAAGPGSARAAKVTARPGRRGRGPRPKAR
jgi:hypothetical protein